MIPSRNLFLGIHLRHLVLSFLPLPDEYGMNLAPNTASSMAVQMNIMQRKPAPYTSKCMKDWSGTNFTVPSGMNYSLSVRLKLRSLYLKTTPSSVSKSATSQPLLAIAPATGQRSSSPPSQTPVMTASSSPTTSGLAAYYKVTIRIGSVIKRLLAYLKRDLG